MDIPWSSQLWEVLLLHLWVVGTVQVLDNAMILMPHADIPAWAQQPGRHHIPALNLL